MERLSFDDGARSLSVDGRHLALDGPLADAWRDGPWVYVLAETLGPRVYALFVYDAATGEARAHITPPEGWDFYRLTDHPRGPSVIATTGEREKGHQDWHFVIDPKAGTVTRTVPSR